ncbi:MAG: sugar ABC transporter ATP-binding protein [Bacteroidota bacterium]
MTDLLRCEKIEKSFGDTLVLHQLELTVRKNELLGLVGENGAGKSTLMNILGGILPPNKGAMLFDGQAYAPKNALEATQAGIAFIHQELNVLNHLTVQENLFLTSMPTKSLIGVRLIDWKQLEQKAVAILNQVGLQCSPKTKMKDLGPAEKQLVEIAKVLTLAPKLIIFDEPTTSLTLKERETLFQLIATLRQQEISMIYISHNLDDILQLSDRIAVLRDGQLISQRAAHTYQKESMIQEMIGRKVSALFPDRHTVPSTNSLLKVEDLSDGVNFEKVSFELHQGEVLGFYGLMGAGRTEVMQTIYGLTPKKAGAVYWKGDLKKRLSPRLWVAQKAAFLTEDRRAEGLMLDHSIAQNIGLVGLRKWIKKPFGLLKTSLLSAAVTDVFKRTNIKAANMDRQEVGTLSGGNQQKAVIAKWLMLQPALFILDEPTKGIDVGAKQEIYQQVSSLVDQGMGVIFVSSEIEVLLAMCDRILVMNQGRVAANVTRADFNKQSLVDAAFHQTETNTVP